MDDDRQQAFMTALVTEHFVLQGARGQTNSEMTGRAALYLATVSSTLIALGFVARDRSAFGPPAGDLIQHLFLVAQPDAPQPNSVNRVPGRTRPELHDLRAGNTRSRDVYPPCLLGDL